MKNRRVARTLAPTLALALAMAGTAYAGGVFLDVKTGEEFTQNAEGVVTLKVEIQRGEFDCAPTVFLPADEKAGAPLMKLERRNPKTLGWTELKAAWVKPDSISDRSWSTPYRLDWGQCLTVTRKAKLEPGVYRVSVKFKALDLGYEDWRTSSKFAVVAP